MTYPNAEIAHFLESRFVPVRFDMTDRDPEVLEVLRAYRLLWAPGFVVLDSRGSEIRRWIGFLEPRQFLAELRVALAKVALLGQRFDDAFAEFRTVADLDPPAPVTPEAVYWSGVAAYRRDGADLEFLRDYWQELRRRFPDDRWWTHANVF